MRVRPHVTRTGRRKGIRMRKKKLGGKNPAKMGASKMRRKKR